MTATSLPPSPVPAACPSCAAPLTGTTTCASCRLPLTGPVAARLWQVDLELLRVDDTRHRLLAERHRLLDALRAGAEQAPAAPTATPWGPTAAPSATRPVREEWTTRRVQNLLLALGGVLLAVAAAVFTAVTYDRLGVGGRAAVLLGLTVLAGAAAPRLRARGLGATAETVAAVTLALAALDAWGLRKLGLGDGLHDVSWLAAVSAVLAGLSAGYASAVPLHLPRLAAGVLANVSLVLVVVRLEAGLVTTSVLLSAVAAADLGAVAALRHRERTAAVRDLLGTGIAAAVVVGAGGLLTAVVAWAVDGTEAAVALAVCAVLAGAAAVVARGALRTVLAGLPVVLGALAALAALGDTVSGSTLPVVAVGTGLVGLGATAALPRTERRGPAAGVAAVVAGAVAAVLDLAVSGLVEPFGWSAAAWTLDAGLDARQALGPGVAWEGTWAVAAVLVAAAAAAGGTGLLIERRQEGSALAAALAAPALLLAPLVLDLPHPAALLVLVALAAAAAAGAEALALRASRVASLACLGFAGAAAALAAGWSLADQGTTLAVLGTVAVLLGLVSGRRALSATWGVAAALAGLVAGAELAAAGAARDLAPEQVGGLLLLAPLVLLAAAEGPLALGEQRRLGLEAASALLTAVAVLLAAGDPGWLSWTLAGAGVLALATALRADRRQLAPLGAMLLIASSWVRLAEAGVDDPEPYALPVAALALLLGHLRFRRDPAVRSQAAYGPGLAVLLLPSLLAAFGEPGLARPLLLGAVALVVLLVGARTRLQAPLVYGAAALAGVAGDLLAPYAAAVPRWAALAAAGTLLVVVGATFEERRRQVTEVRQKVAALR